MTTPAERVLELLPAFYRFRDARPDGEPGYLASLTQLIGEQFGMVADELDQLYDDLFVETCAPWVVPYLGDLVGVQPGAGTGEMVLPRAAVADAIALRRRKGTVAVLEQLAHDLTGWPALAVESFPRLAVTQTVRHVVPGRGRIVDLRRPAAAERIGTAFDSAAHRADVRRIGSGRGRFNVPNVAVFVWRDLTLPHTRIEPATVDSGAGGGAVDPRRFRFRPLGVDGPLVTRPRPEVTITHQASSLDLPVPVTRRAMAAAPEDYYGDGASVAVWRTGEADPVPAADLVVCDLSDLPGGGWSNVARLPATALAIDPALGRFAFGADQAATPLVTFWTSAPADTGGSEITPREAGPPATVVVDRAGGVGVPPDLAAGLAAAAGAGVVEVRDSARHAGDLTVAVDADAELWIRAAPGRQPLVALAAGWTVTVAEGGRLVLEGLVVGGGPLVVRGRPDRVELRACTLVPGYTLGPAAGAAAPVGPSLVIAVDSDWQTEVTLDNCVTGPLAVPADGTRLTVGDSIVDSVRDGRAIAADPAGRPGATLLMRRCTVFGAVSVVDVDEVSDTIFTSRLDVQRRQTGCVQYSWVPPGSATPRLHQCQPADAAVPRPRFASRRFATPGYARLRRPGATALVRGASTGGEMGAYGRLRQTQRDDNLRRGIAEFLRFSLEAGVLDGD